MNTLFENTTSIRDISKRNYLVQLKLIYNLIAKKSVDSINNINIKQFTSLLLNNQSKLKKILSSKYKPNTIRTKIIAIKVYFKFALEKGDKRIKSYDSWFDSLTAEIDKTAGQKTPAEKEQWTTMEALNEKMSELQKEFDILIKSPLTKTTYNKLRNIFICSLHIYLPNPRRNLWRTVIYTSNKDYKSIPIDERQKRNYLIQDKGILKLVINIQKNGTSQTINLYKISAKFTQILKKYIKKLSIQKNALVISNYDGGEITQNYYSNILKRLLGVGSSMIRKFFATENTNTDAITAFNQVTESARASGHAASTRIKYYVKT